MKWQKSIQHLTLISFTVILCVSCVRGKIPEILTQPPNEPYDVIQTIETQPNWGPLHWFWYWWHYMPGYSSIHKVHEKALIKKARKLGADAVINVSFYPKRSGAKGEAIRIRQSTVPS